MVKPKLSPGKIVRRLQMIEALAAKRSFSRGSSSARLVLCRKLNTTVGASNAPVWGARSVLLCARRPSL